MSTRLWIASFAVSIPLTAGSTLALDLGDPAPALQVAEWIKGAPVDFKTGKGKNVYVLDFWATWCAPCRMSMPHLTELQQKYKSNGLVIVSISDEHPRLIEAFTKQIGWANMMLKTLGQGAFFYSTRKLLYITFTN